MRSVIVIAQHKEYPPLSASRLTADPLYLPLQAGSALHGPIGAARDDSGDHISARNLLYCELTAHYWLWKNIPADVYGLCHYRRYFTLTAFGRAPDHALTQPQLTRLLRTADVLVPRPRLYLLETNASHYAHAHRAADLDSARTVIAERCPDFLSAFDRVMKRRWGRRFNMFIMRREQFAAYSGWLFDVLFAIEERLGPDVPPRTVGYLAERLMDVWLEKERPRMKHLRVLNTEGENWPRRITAFLRRKFAGYAKK